MKTKFNHLALVAIALSLGFSNCSNNDNPDDGNGKENKSVFLKISGGKVSTYAENSPATDGATVGFGSGDIYFVNASGAILVHYTLSSSATNLTTGNIALDDITAGQLISNLPGQVTAIHVFGNASGLPATGNISTVKATLKQVTSQGTLASVNLYGTTSTLTPVSGNDYTATISLKPTVARIELKDITSTGVITGFRVDGIFIDNYYYQAAVDGTVVVGNLVNNISDATLFLDNSSAYPTARKTFVYDYFSSGITATSQVATPANISNVWAYNLFANTGSGSFAIPRIVIRLSNIATNDLSTYTNPQFITVKGLKDGSTSLTSIDAGKVYNIGAGALTFKESDLTPAPNMGAIDVTVTVTLAEWEVVSVTPEL
ncbi:hypothetical protein [Dysgonomonas sp.]